MFQGERNVTTGIMSSVPPYLQNVLWYLIETMEVRQKDYLQVFTLSQIWEDGQPKQHILHVQEQLPYRKEYSFFVNTPVKAKIFVIDDGSYSTMLLAQEY